MQFQEKYEIIYALFYIGITHKTKQTNKNKQTQKNPQKLQFNYMIFQVVIQTHGPEKKGPDIYGIKYANLGYRRCSSTP